MAFETSSKRSVLTSRLSGVGGVERHLHAAHHPDLLVEPGEMGADGRHREAELLRDLLVAQPPPHQADDLRLALGERLGDRWERGFAPPSGLLPRLPEEGIGHRRTDIEVALEHLTDGGLDLYEGGRLGEIAAGAGV